MTAKTPMLRQYFATKARYPGVILAMRVGDFYEFYGEDAEIAAREMEITLTGRDDGKHGRIPMAGVPFHSIEKYLARLIKKGYKVALCDQVEDPKRAKGLVRREVTRVLTPGTALEDSLLESTNNNFLASTAIWEDATGVSFLDLSTGEFLVTQIVGSSADELLIEELARMAPAEVLLPEEAEQLIHLLEKMKLTLTKIKAFPPGEARKRLLRQFGTPTLASFGLEELEAATSAAGTILRYLDENEVPSQHIDHIRTYSIGDRMPLDTATIRSLELVANMVDGGKRFTLFEVLDHTMTPMGTRLLKRWITEPLLTKEAIDARLDAVEALKANALCRNELRVLLDKVYDLERLVSRAATGVANPRDLVSLRNSIALIPEILDATFSVNVGSLIEARRALSPEEELLSRLTVALESYPPPTVREGGIIRSGYDSELDELRKLSKEGKEYIARLETTERERTGIERLKAGYNSVFGYYLEVPKSQISKVPETYIRKQTTANAERYITTELKEFEAKILGAEERALEREYALFCELRAEVAQRASALLRSSRAIAEIDVLQSLAEAASRYGYVKPEILETRELDIRGGRHPVVEIHAGLGSFVPNDMFLHPHPSDASSESESAYTSLIILTGPNMSGKSTYLRQTALITLMAHIGSFVPASSARIGLVDRVFARVGARDELAAGQSTFMLEMVEAANILHHATDKSLVILDEIGRGTSTFDGMAIAWAIAEKLADVGARTLFATHYHQLNALSEQVAGVRNFRVAVKEEGDQVIWLHKVYEGGTDKSYGIHVARMAGLPRSVVERAAEVLADLEGREYVPRASNIRARGLQLELFEAVESEVEKRLKEMDITTMTPVEALVLLDDLKRSLTRSKS